MGRAAPPPQSSASSHSLLDTATDDMLLADDDTAALWSPSALAILDDAGVDDALAMEVDAMYALPADDSLFDPNASGPVAPIDRPEKPRLRRRRALVWLRRDLRLHDNEALRRAMEDPDIAEIVPVYVVHRPVRKRCGAVRFQFLLESLAELAQGLAQRHSGLAVLRGEATEVFKVVFPAWGITDLFFEQAEAPYALQRDSDVRAIAGHFGVRVVPVTGQLLFDPRAVLALNNGSPPTDFSRFLTLVEKLPQPRLPTPTPDFVSGWALSNDQLYELLDNYCRHCLGFSGSVIAGPRNAPFAIPGLDAFGLSPPPVHSFLFGGESAGLHMLADYCASDERVGLFQKPKTSPVCIEKPSTTALSAYIVFGCVSVREFYYRVKRLRLQATGDAHPTPVSLDGQLLWREFFYCYCVGVPHFDSQERNPLCKDINWKLQQVPPADSVWGDDTKAAMEQLQSWMTGRTGYPWIDAVMRQIEQEGWAHHVARHAVACFLTRGDLYVSWLRGAYFFQEKLIDLDWAVNVGNWLWVSSSCFFTDYSAVHSPSMFIQQWDPQGKFIRKYVPQLRKMPPRYIFEPWKAPLSVQRTAGCLIGKDYPFPIVDHTAAFKRCLAGIRHAHEDVDAPLRVDRSSASSSGGDGGLRSRSRSPVVPSRLFAAAAAARVPQSKR